MKAKKEIKLKICLKLLFLFLFIVFKGYGQVYIEKDTLRRFDPQKPLFTLTNEQRANRNHLLRFSAVTGYREVQESGQRINTMNSYSDSQTGTVRLCFYNLSIVDILTIGMISPSNVILDVRDPSKYRYDVSYGSLLAWKRKNCYCFEYMYPKGTFKSAEMLYTELSHYFGVKTGWEMRNVDVLVLFRTSGLEKFKSKDIDQEYTDKLGRFHNVPISTLKEALKSAGFPKIVDETNYKGNITLDLNISSWNDILLIRKELQRYDLDLKFEKRDLKMFVIKELNKPII